MSLLRPFTLLKRLRCRRDGHEWDEGFSGPSGSVRTCRRCGMLRLEFGEKGGASGASPEDRRDGLERL